MMATELRHSERLTHEGNKIQLDTVRFFAGESSKTGEMVEWPNDNKVRYATQLLEGLTVIYWAESVQESDAIALHEHMAKWYDLKEAQNG